MSAPPGQVQAGPLGGEHLHRWAARLGVRPGVDGLAEGVAGSRQRPEARVGVEAFLVAAAYERAVTLPLPPPLMRSALPSVAPSGRQLLRPQRVAGHAAPLLRRYVPPMPATVVPAGADHAAVIAYTELLDRSLEDRRLDPDEAVALCELARTWSLTMDHLGEIHRAYVTALVGVAMADRVLSRDEHEDLRRFADLLGVPREAVLEDVASALEGPATGESERA